MEQELEPRVKEGIEVIAKYFEEDKLPCEITLDMPSVLFKIYSDMCQRSYIKPEEFIGFITNPMEEFVTNCISEKISLNKMTKDLNKLIIDDNTPLIK